MSGLFDFQLNTKKFKVRKHGNNLLFTFLLLSLKTY